MAPRTYDLVIFDCDGVIVDSELMSAGVVMQLMADDGMGISMETFRQDFLGRSFASASEQCRKRFGKPLAESFLPRYKSRLLAEMQDNLQPIAGIADVLANMSCPFCLASSSSPERIKVSLAAAGVARFFEGRCFSSAQVTNGKPAPDLFLFAAETMGMEAARSLVIEDSEMGVRAARAAGAGVWHFLGGAHLDGQGFLPGDVTADREVRDANALRQGFAELGLCRI